jgi:carbamoyl-phosphate synthase large subunit
VEASSSQLGVQMKSVGEAMAFGRTFKEALQKALRSLEQGRYGLGADGKDEFDIPNMSEAEKRFAAETIRERLGLRRSDMIFNIRFAFQLGMSLEEIYEATKIDPWFLDQIWQIVRREQELREAASAPKIAEEALSLSEA